MLRPCRTTSYLKPGILKPLSIATTTTVNRNKSTRGNALFTSGDAVLLPIFLHARLLLFYRRRYTATRSPTAASTTSSWAATPRTAREFTLVRRRLHCLLVGVTVTPCDAPVRICAEIKGYSYGHEFDSLLPKPKAFCIGFLISTQRRQELKVQSNITRENTLLCLAIYFNAVPKAYKTNRRSQNRNTTWQLAGFDNKRNQLFLGVLIVWWGCMYIVWCGVVMSSSWPWGNWFQGRLPTNGPTARTPAANQT